MFNTMKTYYLSEYAHIAALMHQLEVSTKKVKKLEILKQKFLDVINKN